MTSSLFRIDILGIGDLCEVNNMQCLYMGRGDFRELGHGIEYRYEMFLTCRGDVICFEPDFMDLRAVQRTEPHVACLHTKVL